MEASTGAVVVLTDLESGIKKVIGGLVQSIFGISFSPVDMEISSGRSKPEGTNVVSRESYIMYKAERKYDFEIAILG